MNFLRRLFGLWSLTRLYSSDSNSVVNELLYEKRSSLGASYSSHDVTTFESRNYSQMTDHFHLLLDKFDIALIQSLYKSSKSNEVDFLKHVSTILNHIPDISAPVPIENTNNAHDTIEMSALTILTQNPKTLNILHGTLDRPEYRKFFDTIEMNILIETSSFKWIDSHLKPVSLFKYEIQIKFYQLIDQILMNHRKSLGAEYMMIDDDDDDTTTAAAYYYTKHLSIQNYPTVELLEFDIYLSKVLEIIIFENIRNSFWHNFGDLLFRHISNYDVKFDTVAADVSIAEDVSEDVGPNKRVTCVKSCLISQSHEKLLSHPDYMSHFSDLFDQFAILPSSEAVDQIIQSFNFLDLFEREMVKTVLSDLNGKFEIYRNNLGGGQYNLLEPKFDGELTIVAAYHECSVARRGVSGSLAQFDFNIIQLFNIVFDLSLDSGRRFDLIKGFLINHIADFYTETEGETVSILDRVISNQDYVLSRHLFRLPDSFHYFQDFLAKIVEKDADWLEPRLCFLQKFSKEIQGSVIDKIDLQIKQYRDTLKDDDDPLKEEEFELSLREGVKMVLSSSSSSKGRRCCSHFVKMLCDNISDLSARFGGEEVSVFSLLLLYLSTKSEVDIFKGTFEYSNYMKYYEKLFDDILNEKGGVDDDDVVVLRSLQFFTVKIQQSIAANLNRAIRLHRQELGAVYLNDYDYDYDYEQVIPYGSMTNVDDESLISFDTHLLKVFGILSKYKEAHLISDCLLNHIPGFDFEGVDNAGNNNNPIPSVFSVLELQKLQQQQQQQRPQQYEEITFKKVQIREYFKKFISCVNSKSSDPSNLNSLLKRFSFFDSNGQVEIVGYLDEQVRDHRSSLGAEYYCNDGGLQVTVYTKRDFNDETTDLDPYESSTSLSQELINFDLALLEAFKIIVDFNSQKHLSLISMILNHISDPISIIPDTDTSAFSALHSQYTGREGVGLGGRIDRPDLKIYFFDYIISDKLFSVEKKSDWSLQFFVPLHFMTPAIANSILDTLDSHIRACRIDLGAHYTKEEEEEEDYFIADYRNPEYSCSHSSSGSGLEAFDISLSQLCKNELSGLVAKVVIEHVPRLIEDVDIQKSLCGNSCLSRKFGLHHSETSEYLVHKLMDHDFNMFMSLLKLFDFELDVENIKFLSEQIHNRRIKLGGKYLLDKNHNIVSVYEERRFTFLFADKHQKCRYTHSPKTSLLHLDLRILYCLKIISEMRNSFDNLALFKMVLSHTSDLKATYYHDNFSALSLIGQNDFLLENLRGSVSREAYEISVYFKQFLEGSAGLKGGAKRVDIDLLALAIFTPEIQRAVIRQFITNFPNTKNLLLHLVLFYRLDEHVFFDLIDAGAQLFILSKEDYENSNVLSKEIVIFADSARYIPSGAFDVGGSQRKSLYVDFDLFTNLVKDRFQIIKGCESWYPNENEANFRCGMERMNFIPETSSLRAAFYNYGKDVALKLVEMSLFKEKEQTGNVEIMSLYHQQTKYNLVHLIVENPNKSANVYFPQIDDELVDYESAIERFNSGIPEIISIAILSTLTRRIDYLNIIESFIEKLKLQAGCKEMNYALLSDHCKDFKDNSTSHIVDIKNVKEMGLLYLPNDTLEDILLTACRYCLPEDALNMLIEAVLKCK